MYKSDTTKEKISDYGSVNTPPATGKKHKLSRFLSRDEGVPGPTMSHQADSTYGSSENTGHHHDIVQVENDGTIPNTNRSQNLALDKETGEVFDEETGQVMTVVTTTTTTTTTTTVRGDQKQQDVRRDVQTSSTQQPYGTAGTAYRDNSGAPSQYTTQPTRDSGYSSGMVPEVPTRSSRRSGEYSVSPNFSGETPNSANNRHNFSYPGRNPPVGTGSALGSEETTATRRSGRFADLKAAAIGLHGVGETLRGTLNKEIDSRYPSKNAEKAAMINARNTAVLDRGRHEMSGIPIQSRYHHDQTPVSPITDHDGSYNRQSLNHSTLQSQTNPLSPVPNSNPSGSAEPGSHSAAFGSTPMGEHHAHSSISPIPALNQTAHDGSSISNLTTSSGEPLYHPSRGTVVRADSSYAPETVSGNVERVTSPTHHRMSTESPIPTPARMVTGNLNTGNSSIGHSGLGQSNLGHSGIGHSDLGHSGTENLNPTSSGIGSSGVESSGIGNSGTGNLGTTSAPTTTGGDFGTTTPPSAADGGIKKSGTFSKLFKRKPLAGQSVTEGDKKKYY